MTKTILAPTDFSENSWVAIQYAAKHAEQIGAQLKIVHIYLPFYSAFAGEKFNEDISTHTLELVEKQMDALLARLKEEAPSLSVTNECRKGVLHTTIKQIFEEEHFDLIIMGTAGASGIKSVIGSNTFDVINVSPVPVLAVPQTTNFSTVKKAHMLSNFKDDEINVLERAISVLPKIDDLLLLHIRENHDESEEVMLRKWKGIIESKVDIPAIDTKIGIGDNLPETINNIVEEQSPDVLIVTQNQKSFFAKLFNRNLVRSIALSPKVPILFVQSE